MSRGGVVFVEHQNIDNGKRIFRCSTFFPNMVRCLQSFTPRTGRGAFGYGSGRKLEPFDAFGTSGQPESDYFGMPRIR